MPRDSKPYQKHHLKSELQGLIFTDLNLWHLNLGLCLERIALTLTETLRGCFHQTSDIFCYLKYEIQVQGRSLVENFVLLRLKKQLG